MRTKTYLGLICILFTLAATSLGQDAFARFTKAVKEERGGFSGNKESLSKVFNEERIRLGSNFETELWKYLGDDADKHYWIGYFLTSKTYLHGNVPLPDLAFQVWLNGLKLLEKRSDERSLGRKVTMYRQLAVSAKLSGKQGQAIRFRDNAESLLAAHGNDLAAFIAGRTEFEICVYETVAGSVDRCDSNPTPKERIISAGWMNGRALNYVKPDYPSTIINDRKAAHVEVRILTDEAGKVVLAEIIRGPIEFQGAAIEAARKLKFEPILLSGVPTKVSGWVSYDFKP